MSSSKYFSVILLLAVLVSCQHTVQHTGQAEKKPLPPTGTFGQPASAENALAASQLPTLFTGSDTAEVIISGDIAASCQHTGCWMDVDMGNSQAVHVTFKDEAFTIPLDAAGKHAIAQGIAIRELVPVETLRNNARDEGKSEEEVARITEPAYSYEMVATGVLIEE